MKKFLAISKRNFFKPLSDLVIINLGAVLQLLSTDLKTKYDVCITKVYFLAIPHWKVDLLLSS